MKRWLGIGTVAVCFVFLFVFIRVNYAPSSKRIEPFAYRLDSPQEPENGEWRGEYVYLGGMKWRLLINSPSPDYDKLTLFLDDVPEEYEQELRVPLLAQDTEAEFCWKTSDSREYLNTDFMDMAFSPEEQQLIGMTSITNDFDDRMFLLPFELFEDDWDDMGFGDENEGLNYKEAWWACESREPVRIEADGSHEIYDSDGLYSEEIQRLEEPAMLRPCCEIDKDSICYVKDASLPLSMEVTQELSRFEQETDPSREWTIVVSSAAQHVTIENVERNKNICRFRYSNATTGEGNGLYAMIRDKSSGDVYAYGKIADTSVSDHGTVEIQLPHFYNRYMMLEVFSERERTTPSDTAYASEPVKVLFGKEAAEQTLISEGELDTEYTPIPCDPIINHYYDTFLLQWDYEDYLNADDEELLDLGTALVLYQVILGGRVEEGELQEIDIRDAEREVVKQQESVRTITELTFENMNMMGLDNLKETMDYGNGVAENLSDSKDIEMVDNEKYTPYLSYTYEAYKAADAEDQQRAITVAIIYMVRYRMNIEISEEEASDEVWAMRRALEAIWEIFPELTLKELLDQYRQG